LCKSAWLWNLGEAQADLAGANNATKTTSFGGTQYFL
jgi:hypothetical protein